MIKCPPVKYSWSIVWIGDFLLGLLSSVHILALKGRFYFPPLVVFNFHATCSIKDIFCGFAFTKSIGLSKAGLNQNTVFILIGL